MQATRNPKYRDALIVHYAACYRDCVRLKWSLGEYLKQRNNRPERPGIKLSHFDQGMVYAASRIYFDMVNSPDHLEWRLGFVDISTATAHFAWKGDGLYVPTHGGHFWRGTDIPFNGWNRMEQEGPVMAGHTSVELEHERAEIS
jgi:hypothetical protein